MANGGSGGSATNGSSARSGAATATASVGSRTSGDGNAPARPPLGVPAAGQKKANGSKAVAETPISSSVQDHFRGFTFQGDSTLEEAMRPDGEEDEEEDGEEGEEGGGEEDEDDWEDEEPGGRYSRKNGRGE